jgi:hypothetical protein
MPAANSDISVHDTVSRMSRLHDQKNMLLRSSVMHFKESQRQDFCIDNTMELPLIL